MNIPKMGINMPNMGMKAKAPVSRVRTGTSLADALFSSIQQRVLAYLFGQPDGLLRDRAKLRKDRRLWIGLVVFLRSYASNQYQPAVLQSRKFALYGT